jgi:hypothetical protein
MRPVVPVLAVIATTAAGAVTALALRSDRDPRGPSKVEAGVTRCTSDAHCTFEDANGALSPPKSTLSPP